MFSAMPSQSLKYTFSHPDVKTWLPPGFGRTVTTPVWMMPEPRTEVATLVERADSSDDFFVGDRDPGGDALPLLLPWLLLTFAADVLGRAS
jgi:hypothetical protein